MDSSWIIIDTTFSRFHYFRFRSQYSLLTRYRLRASLLASRLFIEPPACCSANRLQCLHKTPTCTHRLEKWLGHINKGKIIFLRESTPKWAQAHQNLPKKIWPVPQVYCIYVSIWYINIYIYIYISRELFLQVISSNAPENRPAVWSMSEN